MVCSGCIISPTRVFFLVCCIAVGLQNVQATEEEAPKPGTESVCCECVQQESVASAVKTAYKGVFYDNSFEYLCDPCYDQWYLGDALKRRALTDCIIMDVGGQYRLRQQSEHNMRGLGLTGVDDDFLLHRTRLFANVTAGENLRIYGEMLDAVSNYETFTPRGIEENRADLQNMFLDLRLLDGCCGELWGRAGRQELLYGAERVVSPLDWANTRRTFDGLKVAWKGTAWDIDGFWTRPVPNLFNTESFNNPDQSQEFMGIYATSKGSKTRVLDLYYLRYLELDGGPDPNFEFDTFGARVDSTSGAWLWTLEAAYQFGEFNEVNHLAGFYTLGSGHKFESLCWKPTFWVYYDWASGAAPANGVFGNGYNHLFPLSHKYLGFMDLYGRRNIEDWNFLLTADPHEKWRLLAWWHVFHLQDDEDVPYNVAMRPSASMAGGSRYLGQELDLLATWDITPRLNLLLGYSHFFVGDFYATNPSPGLFDGDADFYYTQMQFNF